MALSEGTKKVLWAVGIAAAILLVTLLIAILIWYFTKGSSGPGKLPTPEGQMNPMSGPYPTYNAITGEDSSGHIPETHYPEKDLYSKYGYRAVYVKAGEVVDRNKSSDIKWNDFLYKVMTYEADERQISGFVFKIPKQKAALIASNVEYELVSTVYDNPNASGTPLYTELILGRVGSEEALLTIRETDDKADNKILIS